MQVVWNGVKTSFNSILMRVRFFRTFSLPYPSWEIWLYWKIFKECPLILLISYQRQKMLPYCQDFVPLFLYTIKYIKILSTFWQNEINSKASPEKAFFWLLKSSGGIFLFFASMKRMFIQDKSSEFRPAQLQINVSS